MCERINGESEVEEIAGAVNEWSFENMKLLISLLKKKREDYVRRRKGRLPSSLDLRKRWLSEMPLCGFWEDIKPPQGFAVSYQEVYVNPSRQDPHLFANGPENLVLCFTPGQFVEPSNKNMQPGERIGILKARAPEFVEIYGDGLARLFGGRNEVWEKLGISY